jgi:hypothetical protein
MLRVVSSFILPSAPAGVRRSTRERRQVTNYKPSMAGKKYSFAAMMLDSSIQHDAEVAYSFMQQLSLKAALKQWGTDAEDAGVKEVSQLHWRDTFVPKRYADLTDEERRRFLRAICLS